MNDLIKILSGWGDWMRGARGWANKQGSVPDPNAPAELLGGPFTPVSRADKEKYAKGQIAEERAQQRIAQERAIMESTAETRLDERKRGEYERLQRNDPAYWGQLLRQNPGLKRYELPKRGSSK